MSSPLIRSVLGTTATRAASARNAAGPFALPSSRLKQESIGLREQRDPTVSVAPSPRNTAACAGRGGGGYNGVVRRRVFTLASVLSLLLCIGATVLWVMRPRCDPGLSFIPYWPQNLGHARFGDKTYFMTNSPDELFISSATAPTGTVRIRWTDRFGQTSEGSIDVGVKESMILRVRHAYAAHASNATADFPDATACT